MSTFEECRRLAVLLWKYFFADKEKIQKLLTNKNMYDIINL